MSFCHMNLHSDRSLMRGMIKPARLVEWAKKNDARAVAITDYGNICAVPELNKACKKSGIKPIYGIELNVVRDKKIKDPHADRIIVIAKNKLGFKNLIKLATLGSMYFYYFPRVDMTDLEKFNEGLIAITGDLQGIVARQFMIQTEVGVRREFERLSKIFPDLYFELEPIPISAQRLYNDCLVKIWKEKNGSMKLIVTGDPHYLNQEDQELHQHYLAIKNWRNPGWSYPFKGPYHVRNLDEMRAGMAELHGYDVTFVPGFKEAFESVNEIIDLVEVFDIREGTKIPTYIG